MPTYTTKTYTNVKPLPSLPSAVPIWVAIDVEFKATAYAASRIMSLAA